MPLFSLTTYTLRLFSPKNLSLTQHLTHAASLISRLWISGSVSLFTIGFASIGILLLLSVVDRISKVLLRYMQQHNEVELFALGMAIATVVTMVEILKSKGLAIEKKIMTSTVDMRDEKRGRTVQKAKILLGKIEKFDELMAVIAEERELAEAEDQS